MIQLSATNQIIVDGIDTGLGLSQRSEGSIIYTQESESAAYKEHAMPHKRYSAAHDYPHKPGQAYDPKICAGRAQLEQDIRVLLRSFSA